MHRAFKLMLPLGALALFASACSSSVSLGDPKPGAPPEVPPDPAGEPVIDVPAPKAALEYPAGPYGKTAGSTIANLSWDGYVNGKEAKDAGNFSTGDHKISLLDYYDPDGSKGIHALKLEAAAVW